MLHIISFHFTTSSSSSFARSWWQFPLAPNWENDDYLSHFARLHHHRRTYKGEERRQMEPNKSSKCIIIIHNMVKTDVETSALRLGSTREKHGREHHRKLNLQRVYNFFAHFQLFSFSLFLPPRDPRPHHAAPTWNSIKREMWWGFSTAWIRYMWKTLIWFNDFVENYLIDFSSQRFLSLSPSSSTHIARSAQSTLSSAVSLVYDLMIS